MAADNVDAGPFDLVRELADGRQHKPWQSGLYSKLLFKSDDLRLVLIAMETGASMKEHHADGTVSIHAIEGTLRVHVEGRERDLDAGQILIVAPGVKHDVEAPENCAFLLTLSWPTSKKLKSLQHRGYGS